MDCPRGKSIICAVSFLPIFREETTDLEITFLATRLSAEGSGIAMWLIHQSLLSIQSMSITTIYVQSCDEERTLEFYNRLGKY